MSARLLSLFTLVACTGPVERNREATHESNNAAAGKTGDATSTCETARRAIENRRFVGWRGLPAGCTPDALFGVAFDNTWGLRELGDAFAPARMHILELRGYYRPLATVRDTTVVMFDGMNPELEAGWDALSRDLGTPEAARDFEFGTIAMTGGERVHASRGITVFVNPENQFVLHIAVYAPTTVDDYVHQLRPSLKKTIR